MTPTGAGATVPAATGTAEEDGGTVRLFDPTSLWNTDKVPTEFGEAADPVLSRRNYLINNDTFSRPVFFAAATDPTWTVAAGEGWGAGRHGGVPGSGGHPCGLGYRPALNVLAPDGTLWTRTG